MVLKLVLPLQEFIDSYLALSEDEDWLFSDTFLSNAWNGYNDHMDSDELNYIDSYISDTAIEKFRELTRVIR